MRVCDKNGAGSNFPFLTATCFRLVPGLKDLKNTVMQPSFQLANPGFRWEYQLIDVGDFQGVGESAPSLHFIQNLGEAEYVVAMYMYMRLLGYPAERITILTTYQGQKALLTDVATSRCANHPYFGMPAVVRLGWGRRTPELCPS